MHLVHDEHDHGHGHSHSHDGAHCHEGGCPGHEHCHSEGCPQGQNGPEETVAVLKYMLDHNEHHAAELDVMAKELRKQGKTAAADMIDKSVLDFQTANMRLKVALSMLGE